MSHTTNMCGVASPSSTLHRPNQLTQNSAAPPSQQPPSEVTNSATTQQASHGLPPFKPQPNCTFLARLPGELRNRIYELTVVDSDPVDAVGFVFGDEDWDEEGFFKPRTYSTYVPPLARTCSQIRRECLGVFFAENTFVFSSNIKETFSQAAHHDTMVPAGVFRGWASSLAAGGWDKLVRRVGCQYHWENRSGMEQIVADLGEDDDDDRGDATVELLQRPTNSQDGGVRHVLQEKPKVAIEVVTSPAMHFCGCDRFYADDVAAFEARRQGKSLRGYDALADILDTLCNGLVLARVFCKSFDVCPCLQLHQ
ncbi:hypothetical protein Q7P37_006974 [Cladosporium fusiforme]